MTLGTNFMLCCGRASRGEKVERRRRGVHHGPSGSLTRGRPALTQPCSFRTAGETDCWGGFIGRGSLSPKALMDSQNHPANDGLRAMGRNTRKSQTRLRTTEYCNTYSLLSSIFFLGCLPLEDLLAALKAVSSGRGGPFRQETPPTRATWLSSQPKHGPTDLVLHTFPRQTVPCKTATHIQSDFSPDSVTQIMQAFHFNYVGENSAVLASTNYATRFSPIQHTPTLLLTQKSDAMRKQRTQATNL